MYRLKYLYLFLYEDNRQFDDRTIFLFEYVLATNCETVAAHEIRTEKKPEYRSTIDRVCVRVLWRNTL